MGKTRPQDKVPPPKRQHCPAHGKPVRAVRVGAGRGKMRWMCPSGCELTRAEVVLR